jgi:NADH-quinone oxidoreductase subunit L
VLTLALVIVLAPLAGFVLQSAVGRRLPRQGDWLTLIGIGAALASSVAIFLRCLAGETLTVPVIARWLQFGPHVWSVGVHVDGLTAVMLVVVTLVSFLVHLFSTAYMHGDAKYWKFFAWLQMFSTSMLVLVLADNVLVLFIGWELVGLCSYKLIGFWSERKDPANAARKAFITTRIGDLGMVAALMLIYAQTHTFAFDEVFRAATTGALDQQVRTWASLGLFFAAMGKSAQFPLHVWLPDAMEGPTPVSALIHAATMVAAGVYLVGRMYPLFTDQSLLIVACVGAVTGLMAGFVALAQDDIKKVLAYSTVSQLGFMFLGLGCGAWHAALFHLTTHAFFKALMFLGSGSVIHACHHEQDMRNMGGLWKRMPITGTTFLVGVLAIAGFPFVTSGFYSKDAILAGAWHAHPALAWVGLFAALTTAFYMFRLFAMTFLGEYRGGHATHHAGSDDAHAGAAHAHGGSGHDAHGHDAHASHEPHESPWPMTVPLVVLGVLSLVAGFGSWHHTLLDPVAAKATSAGSIDHHEHSSVVMTLAIVAGLGGLLAGFVVFAKTSPERLAALKRPFRGLERAFARKFGFDELYREVLLRPAYLVARFFAWTDARGVDGAVNAVGRAGARTAGRSGRFDAKVVDGAVRGTGAAILAGGEGLSRVQSGRIRTYIALGVAAVALVLILLSPAVRGLF